MKKLILYTTLASTLFLSTICSAAEYNTRIPLPGSTVANEKLQYDTLMPVYMAVATKTKNCDKMSVTNTQVTKEPYDLEYQYGQAVAGKWEELWSVNACQQQFEVPIKFILDITGASYVVSPNRIYKK